MNMTTHKKLKVFIFLGLLLIIPLICGAQEGQYARRFQNGSDLYNLTRWHEAAVEFRRAQEIAVNVDDWAAALYWVILSELAYSDYGSALRDMNELEQIAPETTYSRDIVYHRARVYYNQGFFEEALILFNRYTESVNDEDRVSAERRAAAFFWMGECLYSMRQFDEAEKFYSWVIARYPESPKVEASAYRIDLIKHKKIEAQLLTLLQLSHEEALRTSEDYQRTIRTYEYTLNLYQRRLAELTNSVSSLDFDDSAFIADMLSADESPPGSLLDRAIQLGIDLQDILRDSNVGGGSW